MNLNTIAAAVATRFSASVITPPSGYAPITFSTHLLPNAITTTPCVLVKPPAVDLEYAPGGIRSGPLVFPVEFYVAPSSTEADSASALYAWYGVLLDQLTGRYDLGGISEVVDATITGTRAGTLVYADLPYLGIVFEVRVRSVAAYPAATF